MEVSKPIYISLFDIHSALMLLLIIDVCIFTISMAVTILSTFNRTHHSFFNGMFGCKKKKEGEQSRRKENNSITLFGSFLRKEEEGIGRLSTTSNPLFLIPSNWRDLEEE